MGSSEWLHRTEHLFRGLFNEVPLGIAVESLDGHLLLANPALCAMLGYSREELERMSCEKFVDPADSADDLALLSKLRSGDLDRYSIEKRYVRKDGNAIWGRLNVSLIKRRDGQPVRVLALVEDITSHKYADEVRSKHNAIVEASDDAIISITADGLITAWNQGATELFLYSESETVGRSLDMIIPAELQDGERQLLQRLDLGHNVEHHETVRLSKGGQRLTVLLSASPIRNSAGTVVGVSQIMRDVAERNSLVKALRESEEKFRKIFGEAGVGMTICSLEGRLLSANSSLCMFLGYSENEIVGRALQSIVHTADWPSWSRWFAEGTGFHGVEKRFLHKTGRVLTAETSAALIRESDGKPLYFVCQTIDVTERKKAEHAVRQREMDLVEAQRVAGVGSWQWDPHEGRLFCSAEFHRIAGRGPGDISLRYDDLSHVFTPGTWASLLRVTDEAITKGTSYELEGEIVRPDGTTRWVVLRGEPEGTAAGDTVLVRGTVQDISDRKRAERELADLSARFVAAQEEERGHVARELHDDVSQRLALMVVRLDQLRIALPSSPEQIQSVVDDLFEGLSDVSSEVHRLSHRLHPSTLRIGLLPALRSLCMSLERRHGIRVAAGWLDIPESIPNDISLCIYRVAQEALNNVIKHTAVKEARLELVGSPGRLTLRIIDAGRGFEPSSGQTGLGLLSMRERLRLVCGSLTIRSQPSGGTEVIVEVPIEQDARRFPAAAGG